MTNPPSPVSAEEELLKILADYSNDLHNLKMRDGDMPAQAAVKRIKSYGDKRELEAVRIESLQQQIKYHTLKARLQRMYLGGDEDALKTKKHVKSLKRRLEALKVQRSGS